MNYVFAVPMSVQVNLLSVYCLVLSERSLLEICIFCSNECPSELIGVYCLVLYEHSLLELYVLAVPMSVQVNSLGVYCLVLYEHSLHEFSTCCSSKKCPDELSEC